MKKIAVISFIAALGLAAGSAVLAQGERKVTLVGGSVGGAWSAIGNAIGETIRRETPGASFGYEPGREAANIQLVAQGKVELGIAHAQLVKRAQSGEEPFRAQLHLYREAQRALGKARAATTVTLEPMSSPSKG